MGFKNYSLYVVISEEYGLGRGAFEIAKLAIEGGVDILQMREKKKKKDELIELGKKISRLCQEKGTMFIVNDDPFIAKTVGANGLHLGQGDLEKYPLDKVRSILGKDKIIGVSTHSLEQFNAANAQDFDYISFGPLFFTKTKDYFIGTKDMAKIAGTARKPVVFIGGINLDNISEVLQKGGRVIGLIRAILESEDIPLRTKQFKEKLEEYKKGGVNGN